MWTPVYYVRLVSLPMSVDGVSVPNDDGSFDIYLNADQCEARQQDRLQHEIEHIIQDHFYQDTKNVAQLEQEANQPDTVQAEIHQPEKATPQEIPNVFKDPVPGKIPCFSSLDSFKNYLLALRKQELQKRNNGAPNRNAV